MSSNVVSPLHVLVIVASTRPGRLAPAVADWFVEATRGDAARAGTVVEIADLAEIGLPLLDEPEEPSRGVYHHDHTRAWSRTVVAADAFVIVTPEYNYGMPAALKNAIDYLYHEWAWKPVGFVSYGHTSAGTRSVQMTKQVVTTLKMVPIGAAVALRIADSVKDDQVVRGDSRRDASARDVLAELSRVAQALRPLRLDSGDEQDTAVPADGLTLAPGAERDLPDLPDPAGRGIGSWLRRRHGEGEAKSVRLLKPLRTAVVPLPNGAAAPPDSPTATASAQPSSELIERKASTCCQAHRE